VSAAADDARAAVEDADALLRDASDNDRDDSMRILSATMACAILLRVLVLDTVRESGGGGVAPSDAVPA
jgi:hypothetical protein